MFIWQVATSSCDPWLFLGVCYSAVCHLEHASLFAVYKLSSECMHPSKLIVISLHQTVTCFTEEGIQNGRCYVLYSTCFVRETCPRRVCSIGILGNFCDNKLCTHSLFLVH